jgi:hypothetical protein
MSKLKIVEMVEVTVPFIEVPGAASGEDESMGMIRWGISYSPDCRVVGQAALADSVAEGVGEAELTGTDPLEEPVDCVLTPLTPVPDGTMVDETGTETGTDDTGADDTGTDDTGTDDTGTDDTGTDDTGTDETGTDDTGTDETETDETETDETGADGTEADETEADPVETAPPPAGRADTLLDSEGIKPPPPAPPDGAGAVVEGLIPTPSDGAGLLPGGFTPPVAPWPLGTEGWAPGTDDPTAPGTPGAPEAVQLQSVTVTVLTTG